MQTYHLHRNKHGGRVVICNQFRSLFNIPLTYYERIDYHLLKYLLVITSKWSMIISRRTYDYVKLIRNTMQYVDVTFAD